MIGQRDVVSALQIKINAYRKTRKLPGHMLFLGPSGTGKTTFALAFAKALGLPFSDSTGDSFRNKAELVQYISNMPNNSVWFIDEIHRLPSKAQDAMLVFLEKGVIDGVQKNVLVIGATTHWGDLREAFLMRFAFKPVFSVYSFTDIIEMMKDRALNAHGVSMHYQTMVMLAGLTSGIARKMAHLVDNLIEYANGTTTGCVVGSTLSSKLVHNFLNMYNIDPLVGLTAPDRQYLAALNRQNRALGSEAIARLTNMPVSTIVNTTEPVLLQEMSLQTYNKDNEPTDLMTGPFVELTVQGRVITNEGRVYLDLCQRLQKAGWFSNENF